MRPWIEPADIYIPETLRSAVGGHPLVAQTLVRRGLSDTETALAFLDPAHYTPTRPTELPGMERAADRLEAALRHHEIILVWGDFDVDGQTATTLLVSALRDLGGQVNYHIPVRERESHGVNLPVLRQILEDNSQAKPGLVLTCDTGIAAHEAVHFAQERGVDVVITDHHELSDTLPKSFAVVNPKLLPDGHPLCTLPGVGVAYKLIQEMYWRSGRIQDPDKYLDLVALGIVADVATQYGETRYLLQRGLAMLRDPGRLGLQVMMELAELDPTWLSEEHIGFVLAPRLNALGRLADANPVVELLTTIDLGRARLLAQQLEGLNSWRRLLTSQVYKGALAQIEADSSLLDYTALVLSNPSWPAGVIGIVASRLVKRYHKPAILIATPSGELGRGSARSIPGVDITAAIDANSEMLVGFGGHKMAAGFSITPDRIPEFRRALSQTIQKIDHLPDAGLTIDGYLPISELSLDLVADLERLAPFGPGNPPLVLASRGLRLKDRRPVGRNDEHLLLIVEDEQGVVQRVIWWDGGDELGSSGLPDGIFDMAYLARTSTFRGLRDVQVEWVGYRVSEDTIVVQTPAIKVSDYRQESHPLPVLHRLQAQGEIQVWAEGDASRRLGDVPYPILNRYELTPGEVLVVWTTPPGRAEMKAAVEKVQPRHVVLFSVDPDTDQPDTFLKRLAGLVKYALQTQEGQVRLSRLSAAMAHKEITVRKGLEWLAAHGHIVLHSVQDDEVIFSKGGQVIASDADQIADQLGTLLKETVAYRAYFTRAEEDTLIKADWDN